MLDIIFIFRCANPETYDDSYFANRQTNPKEFSRLLVEQKNKFSSPKSIWNNEQSSMKC